jgi:NAD(P)H-dependent FMN reductase
MRSRKKIMAINGSTRKDSSNRHLITAIAALCEQEIEMSVFDRIGNIPQFNPDDAGYDPELADFKSALQSADAILICTPEYAHGVPGALKNAIDWTVASGEFSQKPTALITASTDGQFGHQALLETLRVIEAKDIMQNQLLISFVKTKISRESIITDPHTKEAVLRLLSSLMQSIPS